MRTFNFMGYKNCHLVVTKYRYSDSVALFVVNKEDGEIACLTKCLDFVSPKFAFLDTNNVPQGKTLIENDLKIGIPTEVTRQSGFCTYPLFMIDIARILDCGFGECQGCTRKDFLV